MIVTLLAPRQAMVARLDQWRHAIINCDDAVLPDQVRDLESISRMLHSVMLDTVAELESRSIAVTAGFRDTKQLLAGLGVATLDYGTEPLDVGRAMRTVPLFIRRALVARDCGCAFPGCDRPPGMCHAHHCRHWMDGGETSVDNCILLCEAHHRHVHHTGWEILIHHGQVELSYPPSSIPPALHYTTHCAAKA